MGRKKETQFETDTWCCELCNNVFYANIAISWTLFSHAQFRSVFFKCPEWVWLLKRKFLWVLRVKHCNKLNIFGIVLLTAILLSLFLLSLYLSLSLPLALFRICVFWLPPTLRNNAFIAYKVNDNSHSYYNSNQWMKMRSISKIRWIRWSFRRNFGNLIFFLPKLIGRCVLSL